MKRCNTCGGEYEPELPDGYTYYHRCPPTRIKKRTAIPDKPGEFTIEYESRPNIRNENLVFESDALYAKRVNRDIKKDGSSNAPTRQDKRIASAGSGVTDL